MDPLSRTVSLIFGSHIVRYSRIHGLYKKLLHQVSPLLVSEDSIYDYEWDLLIVLDACRLDLMQDVAGEYDFIGDVSQISSVDTRTVQWMEKTFVPEHADQIADTHYVCGSPFSSKVLNENEFAGLDEVWRYHWNSALGTLPPRPLTDRAIAVGRERAPERVLVHYMQPHWPFISEGGGGEDGLSVEGMLGDYQQNVWENNDGVWEELRTGRATVEGIWRRYRANLEYVLEDVGLLLENFDAKTAVITSDHGNAMGEWGIYGHPMHMPLACLRLVPWIETVGVDENTHSPDRDNLVSKQFEKTVAERLQSLGYRE